MEPAPGVRVGLVAVVLGGFAELKLGREIGGFFAGTPSDTEARGRAVVEDFDAVDSTGETTEGRVADEGIGLDGGEGLVEVDVAKEALGAGTEVFDGAREALRGVGGGGFTAVVFGGGIVPLEADVVMLLAGFLTVEEVNVVFVGDAEEELEDLEIWGGEGLAVPVPNLPELRIFFTNVVGWLAVGFAVTGFVSTDAFPEGFVAVVLRGVGSISCSEESVAAASVVLSPASSAWAGSASPSIAFASSAGSSDTFSSAASATLSSASVMLDSSCSASSSLWPTMGD